MPTCCSARGGEARNQRPRTILTTGSIQLAAPPASTLHEPGGFWEGRVRRQDNQLAARQRLRKRARPACPRRRLLACLAWPDLPTCWKPWRLAEVVMGPQEAASVRVRKTSAARTETGLRRRQGPPGSGGGTTASSARILRRAHASCRVDPPAPRTSWRKPEGPSPPWRTGGARRCGLPGVGTTATCSVVWRKSSGQHRLPPPRPPAPHRLDLPGPWRAAPTTPV